MKISKTKYKGEFKERAKCNSKTWHAQNQIKAQLMLNNVTKKNQLWGIKALQHDIN